MVSITLPQEPNFAVNYEVDDIFYTFTFMTINGITVISVSEKGNSVINSVRAISGQWVLPYKKMEKKGNFMFTSEGSDDYPIYTGFNTTFKFGHYTADEVEEIGW